MTNVAEILKTVVLSCDDDRHWAITVGSDVHVLETRYDLNTALWIASEYVERKFGVTDVQWASTGSHSYGVARWELPR